MKIEVGKPAPDFSLYDSDKKQVSLSQYRGKNVLLLFFPFAFTSTCTKELCAIRDNIAFYNNADAVVFGISVDSLYTLARYKTDQGLNFSLLSDFNKVVSSDYDSLYESFSYGTKGVSKRSAFVVDRTGIVRYAEVLENASDVPDFVKVNQVLTELKTKN
jgi:peroxiredoxin